MNSLKILVAYETNVKVITQKLNVESLKMSKCVPLIVKLTKKILLRA